MNFDLSLFEDFLATEQVKVQFRTEFFNVFNTPQFDLPNATISSGAAVGTITGVVGIPRQIQFGLKIVFRDCQESPRGRSAGFACPASFLKRSTLFLSPSPLPVTSSLT